MSDTVPLYRTTITIPFHDTDMAGIVHFSNFLRYCERVEHEFLSAHNIPVISATTGWPRVSCNIDYRAPLRLHDELIIELFCERPAAAQ